MRERFSRFMQGRYGNDQLNRMMMVITMVILVLSMITKWSIFYILGILLLVFSYSRMFSRNRSKQAQQNRKYLKLKGKIVYFFSKKHKSEMKKYRYFRCPSCGQKVRVPRGKGKIKITCPKCHTSFKKRS